MSHCTWLPAVNQLRYIQMGNLVNGNLITNTKTSTVVLVCAPHTKLVEQYKPTSISIKFLVATACAQVFLQLGQYPFDLVATSKMLPQICEVNQVMQEPPELGFVDEAIAIAAGGSVSMHQCWFVVETWPDKSHVFANLCK